MAKRKLYLDALYNQHALIDRNVFDVEVINPATINFTSDRKDDTFFMYHEVYWNFGGIANNLCGGSLNEIYCNRERDFSIRTRCDRHGIDSPKLYHSGALLQFMSILSPDTKYILRYLGHARSLGMLVFERDDLYSILNDADELSVDEFNTKHNVSLGKLFSDYEKGELYTAINSGTAYISEMVAFEEEYRFLMFRGNNDKPVLIIEHRKGYGPNSTEKRRHSVITPQHFEATHGSELYNKIVNSLYGVLKEMNVPALSFDVYINGDDWGLFEYSTQFGIEYKGYYTQLITAYTNALTIVCDEIPKKFYYADMPPKVNVPELLDQGHVKMVE